MAAVRARRPSLLVLDIWMQGAGMDGLELLDLVKELDPDLPVVMSSGHGTIETAVSAIKKSVAYDFLEKPFKIRKHTIGDPEQALEGDDA